MAMELRADDLRRPEVLRLLQEHLHAVAQLSPPESVHALGLEGLRQPDVSVWTAWQGDELLGIGALKQLSPLHGEIKSMRTDPRHLRKGVAATLLQHIIEQAAKRGYERLSLETGSMAAFAPAHRLYARFGFEQCAPFADYRDDPNSVFMTRAV
jgi:putative acetyltransferase